MVANSRKKTPPISNSHDDSAPIGSSVYDDEDMELINTAEHDFLPDQGDPKLAALTREMFSTKVGKLRKAVLNPRQAVALSRARAYADMYDIPELSALCDMLSDSTVSIGGRGLHQMVTVMSARMQAEDDDGLKRLGRNLGI